MVKTLITAVLIATLTPAAISPIAHSEANAPMTAHSLIFESITGGELPLSDFAGKAVLVVNTASMCGFTRQYSGLQKLWDDNKDRGVVVLGVPSNDFGGQEPGSEAEIKSFCEVNFGINFPMTAKVATKGDGAHPFYAWAVDTLGPEAQPKWNFHKILIGPGGEALGAFPSRVEPDDPQLLAAIDQALTD